jgi:hypothetical protein
MKKNFTLWHHSSKQEVACAAGFRFPQIQPVDVYVRVCVFVCVTEREKSRESEERERERTREERESNMQYAHLYVPRYIQASIPRAPINEYASLPTQ